MKLILVLLAISPSCFGQASVVVKHRSSGGGSPAFVSSFSNNTGGTNAGSIAVSITPTSGHDLWFHIRFEAGCGSHTWTITGGGNTYTQIGSNLAEAGFCVAQFSTCTTSSCTHTSGGTFTLTVTIDSSTPNFWSISGVEMSGITKLDTSATGTASGAVTVTSSTFTTATANELLVQGASSEGVGVIPSSCTFGGSAGTVTATSSYTGSCYLAVTSIQSSITGAVTFSSTNQNLSDLVATFR